MLTFRGQRSQRTCPTTISLLYLNSAPLVYPKSTILLKSNLCYSQYSNSEDSLTFRVKGHEQMILRKFECYI